VKKKKPGGKANRERACERVEGGVEGNLSACKMAGVEEDLEGN